MNEDINRPNQKGCAGPIMFLVALLAAAFLSSLMVPTFGRISERGNVTKGISNCRQIITAMRIYSSDHDGKYPDAALTDPRYSNEVFRILFTEGILDNEQIFGCPVSKFVPDGNIGAIDDEKRSEAVKAGENHWAMTRGLSEKAAGEIPLVYENPVKATWPPMWNVDLKETNVRGRAWSQGIIIGLNDSSVSIRPLASKSGTAVPLKKENGRDPFEATIDQVSFPERVILDIEER